MIEGLRLLPFYEEALDERKILACNTCKERMSVSDRQGMGCGFERAEKGAQPWTPAFWVKQAGRAQSEEERARWKPSVCPGYTTTLPEVREVLALYPQWEARTLTDALSGESPTVPLLEGLSELRGGIRELERSHLPEPKAGT